MKSDDGKEMTSFRLTPNARQMLRDLAKADLRTMTGEIEYLIIQETSRRTPEPA